MTIANTEQETQHKKEKEARSLVRLMKAIADLNYALANASRNGLTVELNILDVTSIDDITPKAFVDGRVFNEEIDITDLPMEEPGKPKIIEPVEDIK